MDINELRKLPLPKLREQAKQLTDLEGVIGMKKEELLAAIAKAQGLSYETPAKDVATISSLKREIRALKKQKAGILASGTDGGKTGRIRKKIKLYKRMTRKLSREAKAASAKTKPSESAPAATPAA